MPPRSQHSHSSPASRCVA